MKCTAPVNLGMTVVPCGYCLACRLNKTREWSVRLMHELAYWNSAVFVTMTYDDEHLVSDGLDKDELVRTIKRLRKRLGDRKIKYYIVGEYGKLSYRPHYHAIIFGLKKCGMCSSCNKLLRDLDREPLFDCADLYDSWGHGQIDVGDVTAQSCRYVCEYLSKKMTNTMALYIQNNNMVKPFKLSSQGLGKRFALKNVDQIIDQGFLTVRGSKMAIPKYYKDILGVKNTEEVRERMANDLKKQLDSYLPKVKNLKDACDLVDDDDLGREQLLEAQMKMRDDRRNL